MAILILVGFLLTSTFNACSPFRSDGLDELSSSGDLDATAFSEATFKTTLHPLLKNNCAQCHGVSQEPLHSVENYRLAHSNLMRSRSIDLDRPSASGIIATLNSGHNGVSSLVIDDILLQIEKWSAAMVEYNLRPDKDQRPPDESVAFESASVSSVLMKLKALTHGGALTEEEWLQFSGKPVLREQLKALVSGWIDTDEGRGKLMSALERALNHDITLSKETNDLFRGVRDLRFQYNMRDSMTRTALDLIDRGRPFHEIATTRRFAVTSALLMGYGWMDDRERTTINLFSSGFRQLMRSGQLVDADFNDWRFVTFSETGEGESAPKYDNLSHWRSVGAEQVVPMGIPRIGYFSTLAFHTRYPTNEDNQFRVITNQTVIAGLGLSFNPNDQTHQPLEVGIPIEHSKPGTQCFGCHRLMDPMRLAFGMKMSYHYRYGNTYPVGIGSFAISGHSQPIRGLAGIGESVAAHPNFALAWVQKMCQSLNSSPCAISDPEFKRIVNDFKASRFDFKQMYLDLLTSSLVTGASPSLTSETLGFKISRSRKNHFCHSLIVRKRQLQEARGLSLSPFDRGRSICRDARLEQSANAIGEDVTVRGVKTEFNSFPLDTFSMQAFERLCQSFAFRIVRDSDGIATSASELEDSMDQIVSFIAGLPASHPRHVLMRQAAREIYDEAVNNQGMNHIQGLREAAVLACRSPDFVGVGL